MTIQPSLEMRGGRVLETRILFHANYGRVMRVWVTDAAHTVHRAILTKIVSKKRPKDGDFVRWDGDTAFWSARDRSFIDRSLTMFGGAFDPHVTPTG